MKILISQIWEPKYLRIQYCLFWKRFTNKFLVVILPNMKCIKCFGTVSGHCYFGGSMLQCCVMSHASFDHAFLPSGSSVKRGPRPTLSTNSCRPSWFTCIGNLKVWMWSRATDLGILFFYLWKLGIMLMCAFFLMTNVCKS